jgi:hypothetical protein
MQASADDTSQLEVVLLQLLEDEDQYLELGAAAEAAVSDLAAAQQRLIPHMPAGESAWAAAGEGLLPVQGCYVGPAMVLAQHQQQVQQLLSGIQGGQQMDWNVGAGFEVDLECGLLHIGGPDGMQSVDIRLKASAGAL